MKLETITKNYWKQLNLNYLMQEIARVQSKLYEKTATTERTTIKTKSFDLEETELEQLIPSFSLNRINKRFGLSPFEKDILLLCVGMELERGWGLLCGEAQGSKITNYPTFSLALSSLDYAHLNAITPDSPLRHWRLIELKDNSNNLTTKELVIDEQIFHYLVGNQHLNPRLTGLLNLVDEIPSIVPSHQKIVEQLTQIWLQSAEIPLLHLYGSDLPSKKAIATAIADKFQLNLYTISAEIITKDTDRLDLFKCLLEREWILNESAFFLEYDRQENSDRDRNSLGSLFLDSLRCPLIISSQERLRERAKPLISIEVKKPTTEEQRFLWSNSLEQIIPDSQEQIETLVSYFNLNLPAIENVCLQLKTIDNNLYDRNHLNQQLWQMCRTQARPHLEQLTQRIESGNSWSDLILPESELNVLRELATHVRHKDKVYHHWGFGKKNARGLGISALFAGASGTGKTLAAEVLGNELELDVYRIDLSSVVSKYIGETEKNLKKIFDAAEGCGSILLFDEADALFGKRSEVKDSHDRYANMEVSYLLQRIESYQGLAILTTNLKDDLDRAFLRRIRFIVQFPFPDLSQRTAIWQRIFPASTPTQNLNFQKLAKLNVAGGNIRNIAINAAFNAANERESVQMKHILQAAKSEYSKLEKPLTDNEVKGWILH